MTDKVSRLWESRVLVVCVGVMAFNVAVIIATRVLPGRY